MGFERFAPFQILIPCGRGKSLIGWHFEHIGITEASTAHARAVQNHHTFENGDLQNAMRTDGGHPNIFPKLPVGFCEVTVIKPFAFFKYKNGITFFS